MEKKKSMIKLKVKAKGRKNMWIPEKESLNLFIKKRIKEELKEVMDGLEEKYKQL